MFASPDFIMGAGVVFAGIMITVTLLVVGGIIWGIAKAAGWGGKKRQLPQTQREAAQIEPPKPKSYTYVAEDGSATPDQTKKVLQGCVDDPVVGTYARDAVDALAKSELKSASVRAALAREFEEGSISWDKFASPVEASIDAIRRNCAVVANRAQTFETDDYLRLERLSRAGGLQEGSASWQQWDVYRSTLGQLDDLRSRNERLIVSLDTLTAELEKLSSADLAASDTELLADLAQLAEDARLYG